MHELTVIGAQTDALLLEGSAGEKFKVSIDEALRSALRSASTPDAGSARRLSPREIQAHIRAGMSASDVASITGASLEYIEKFEGPVLAEREYVIESALAIPVNTAADTDPVAEARTFGSVILARLSTLGASSVRWASWKEPDSGWTVKLAFTADSIDHDARWGFDPRKSTLVPANNEAITLSQQGEAAAGLIPRLRAVAPESRALDESRFDSGAFQENDLGMAETQPHPAPSPVIELGVRGPGTLGPSVPLAGSDSAETPPTTQTADLLEALRRRRGEREAATYDDDEFGPSAVSGDSSDHPSTGNITLLDAPVDGSEALPELLPEQSRFAPPTTSQPSAGKGGRKGRVAMPSWDEIVFGARTDDDPA